MQTSQLLGGRFGEELSWNLGDDDGVKAAYRGGCQSLPEPPRKERYAMSRDTTIIALRQPDNIDDPLTELAREGARRMLAQVLIAEADAFIAMWKDLKLPDGRDRIVRLPRDKQGERSATIRMRMLPGVG